MGRRREERLVEQIFPVTGEFLLRDDAGAHGLLPIAARKEDRIAQPGVAGLAEFHRRQIERAQGLHQAEAAFLIVGKRMGGGDPAGRVGQPYAFRLGDQIADGQNKPAVANDDPASGALGSQDGSRESVLRNRADLSATMDACARSISNFKSSGRGSLCGGALRPEFLDHPRFPIIL